MVRAVAEKQAYNAAYHAANRETIRARKAALALSRPERRGVAQKKWRTANPEKQRAASAAWEAARPGWHREYHFKKKYSITIADVAALLDSQQGQCAICCKDITGVDNRGRMLARVDHCHTTRQVRGLLCHSCNTAIGHLRDDPVIILNALAYVSKSAI